MKLCNDRDTAEELLQETFYQAVRCADKYEGQASIYSWLCGIAKNLWYQELRRKKQFETVELDENFVSDELSPEEFCLRKTRTAAALEQIHQLPEQEKEVVLLRGIASLSFREIGQVMGKSENWARVTFFRARKKIKED